MAKRALLVGAGEMGKAWARNLIAHPDAELAGWVDLSIERVDAACESTGISVSDRFADHKEGLRIAPDFVVDVTVPEAHHDVTISALDAGVPVIGEKPMASSMAAAREMVRASGRTGKLYMVSQSRRYNSGLVAFRDLLRQSIGRLGILNADFYLGPHFGGFRDEMDQPLLLDMAIHTFDAARFLADADPVAVYAESFNPEWSWYAGDACATALFEMSNGLRFTYRGSWCAEGVMTSWEADWRVVGEHGSAIWNGSDKPRAEICAEPGGFFSRCETVEADARQIKQGIAGSLDEFLTALETGETPNGECHDNIKSLAMVFGAIESARRGERVTMEEILSATSVVSP